MIFAIKDVVGKSLLEFAADIERRLAGEFANEYDLNEVAELFARQLARGYNDSVVVTTETIELPENDTLATREFLRSSILEILNGMSVYEIRDIFEACWSGPKVRSKRSRGRRARP